MATETTTRLTSTEAIEAFTAARKNGEGVRVWCYSPNGGMGGPAGNNSWATDEWADEILAGTALGLDDEDTEYAYDPAERTLDVRTIRPRGIHQYYTLSYQATPDAGRRRVAYLGAHAGFCWEEGPESAALKTLLEDLSWDDEALAEIGVASCEDYNCGDDGGYWLVTDEPRFAAVAEKCQALDRDWEDLDAEDVRAYLRDGTLPEGD
jgi:hypothetical protein